MVSKNNFFKKIDEKVISAISYVTQNKLTKIDEQIESSLSSEAKTVVYQATSLLLVALPLLLALGLFFSNNNLRDEISETRSIINNIKSIEQNEVQINRSVKSLIASKNITPAKNLSKYFYSKLKISDVTLNNIIINSSEVSDTIGDVEIIQIDGEIKGLGSKEVTKALNILDELNPSSLNEIEITKDKNLLTLKFNLEARAKK